ncbi:unnamed protein product [Scytosiphon promiscuus]
MEQAFKLSDGYRNWAAFVDEFRRIEESLQESKRVERLLVVRCNALKSEIVDSGKKLHTVMSVRAEDEKTIALLRKECDLSAATAAEAKIKQKQAMALVSGLQADIGALQAQVGVLQSALWLERERANAAVNASKGVSGGRGGPPRQRRPLKQVGGAKVGTGRRGHGASSRRPATASAVATPTVAHQGLGKCRASGGAGDPCGSSGIGEFRGGVGGHASYDNNDDECDFGTLQGGAYHLDTSGSGAASTTDALGLGGWATHGIDGYFHGGGRDDNGQRERRLREFVLDLSGSGGNGFGGGGVRSGVGDFTPFEMWKRQKGIFSPGVAQVFGGRTCRP